MRTPLAERRKNRETRSDHATIPIKRPNPLPDPSRRGRLYVGGEGCLIGFQDYFGNSTIQVLITLMM